MDDEALGYIKATYWLQLYNTTIQSSDWLLDKSISPGRWATGGEYLYVLYRLLNDMQPRSILELGLGQSSKLTGQWAKHAGIPHTIVEHDAEWVEYFSHHFDKFSANTELTLLPLVEREKYGDKYFAYDGFADLVQGRRFEVISIDGPFGGDGKASRRDVVELLPDILADDFAIMFDDCGRIGERTTVEETAGLLHSCGVPFEVGFYDGGSYKQTYIITSPHWKWLTTL